jgi:hypothetical protein
MSRLTLGPGHRATVLGIPAVVLPDRYRPGLRGLPYVMVGRRSPVAGPMLAPGSVPGDFTLAQFLALPGIDV